MSAIAHIPTRYTFCEQEKYYCSDGGNCRIMPEDIELTWFLNDLEEDQERPDLLATYYKHVACGPMKDYRRIIQGGNKQGQNYYVHVLDGINVFHKLRTANIVEMNDLEEMLLFTTCTAHDCGKALALGDASPGRKSRSI